MNVRQNENIFIGGTSLLCMRVFENFLAIFKSQSFKMSLRLSKKFVGRNFYKHRNPWKSKSWLLEAKKRPGLAFSP